MENQKNNKGVIILLIIIIVILAILCILFATGTISFKSNYVDNTEIKQNIINNDNLDNNEILTASQVASFIVSNNFISTDNVVADNLPDGYVFKNDGKFAYHNPSFHTRFVESEENRLISFIGTWSTDGNKLILNVSKEEYAVNGKINETPGGNYLRDFSKEVKDINKTIEYKINKIDNTSDTLPFISLSLNNNEVKWYSLPSIGEYLNIPTELVENGYSEKYYQLVK